MSHYCNQKAESGPPAKVGLIRMIYHRDNERIMVYCTPSVNHCYLYAFLSSLVLEMIQHLIIVLLSHSNLTRQLIEQMEKLVRK